MVINLRVNLISTKVSASHRKSTQVHARPGKTDSASDTLTKEVSPLTINNTLLSCGSVPSLPLPRISLALWVVFIFRIAGNALKLSVPSF